MRVLVLAWSLLACSVACSLACASSPSSPPFAAGGGCDAPEYHRLDFWLGEWEVRSPSGELEGTNVVARTLRGCAIEERWTDANGGKGQSFFFYDRAARAWKQTWVTEDGGWKEKREVPFEGGVRFAGELPSPNGGVVHDRTTLTRTDGGVRQLIEQSRDGVTWKSWEGVYARPTACTGRERELDFWIGEWDVVVRARKAPTSDEWSEARGRNTISRTLGGCAIEERFEALGPQSPWRGASFSRFVASESRWRQTWVDDEGGYMLFVGGPDPIGFVFTGEPRTKDGTTSQMRMVFHDVTPNGLGWRWERTVDGGATWTPMMTIAYARARN